MKIESLALSVTCLLAVIARFGVATKTVSIDSPLADGTIESGGDDTARAS